MAGLAGEPVKRITLDVDDLDFAAIQRAITRRQRMYQALAPGEGSYAILPDGEGSLAGRMIAEICRGWEELADRRIDDLR